MTVERATTGDAGAETVEEPPVPERRPPPDRPGTDGTPSRADSRAGAAAANDSAGEKPDATMGEDKPAAIQPEKESSSGQAGSGGIESESERADAAVEEADEQSTDVPRAPSDAGGTDIDGGEHGRVAEDQVAPTEGADAAVTSTDDGASSSEEATGQTQSDVAESDPAADGEAAGADADDEEVIGPAETAAGDSEDRRNAADPSRDLRRGASDEASEGERSGGDPAEIVVPVRAGRNDQGVREEVRDGSSSNEQRTATGGSWEGDPIGTAGQRTDVDLAGADTGPSVADVAADPVIGEDGSWDWKGLRLEPEENQIADLAHAEWRIAEGRDEAGNYGEHGLTPTMRRIESGLEHAELVGCPEFSLKSEERFKEKLAKKISETPGLPAREVAARIHDGIRYTFTFEAERYSDGVRQTRERLQGAGYSLEFQRPTWDDPEYKGVNSRWRDAESGRLFEVQFHTPQSWDAKQKTHDAYAKMAAPTTPPEEVARLQEYQREVTALVSIPPGALEIPYYEKEE